jgi:hypothetical protein
MHVITLAEAQKRLFEIVHDLGREGEFLIVEGDAPVAKLSPMQKQTSLRDLKPHSVGALLRPFPDSSDDLLDEMLNTKA